MPELTSVDFVEHINPQTRPHMVYLVARYPADVDLFCKEANNV